jgi:hypothetical protein
MSYALFLPEEPEPVGGFWPGAAYREVGLSPQAVSRICETLADDLRAADAS